MLGHSHAMSGAAAGLAAATLTLHLPASQAAILAGLTAGAAVLPDIDHPGSSLARSFGFATRAFARAVGRVSGGHRHGTHSLAGAGVFTGLAWLAVTYRADLPARVALGVFLALIIAGGLIGLRLGGHWADLLAIAAAVVMVVTGTGLHLVALTAGLGCVTHLAGDMLTDSGIPLLLPFTSRRFRFWPEPFAFTTGTRPELWLIDPALAALIVFLAWHAVTLPGFLP